MSLCKHLIREKVAKSIIHGIYCQACYYEDNDINDADDIPCVHSVHECISCNKLFFLHPNPHPVDTCICKAKYEWNNGVERCPIHTIVGSSLTVRVPASVAVPVSVNVPIPMSKCILAKHVFARTLALGRYIGGNPNCHWCFDDVQDASCLCDLSLCTCGQVYRDRCGDINKVCLCNDSISWFAGKRCNIHKTIVRVNGLSVNLYLFYHSFRSKVNNLLSSKVKDF